MAPPAVAATPDRSLSTSASFTPSVGGSPPAAQEPNLATPIEETAVTDDDPRRREPGPSSWAGAVAAEAAHRAGDRSAASAMGDLAVFVGRQDALVESRLQQQRTEIIAERQEMILELERSELEMERCRWPPLLQAFVAIFPTFLRFLCVFCSFSARIFCSLFSNVRLKIWLSVIVRSEMSGLADEIDGLRKEAAVRLYQDTAFFTQQKHEIESLQRDLSESERQQAQRDEAEASEEGAATSPSGVGLGLAPGQQQIASTGLVPVVSELQLSSLQERLLSLHTASLFTDEEYYQLEDLCADFLDIRTILGPGGGAHYWRARTTGTAHAEPRLGSTTISSSKQSAQLSGRGTTEYVLRFCVCVFHSSDA